MCGIAGEVGYEQALSLPGAKRMQAVLRRRGPDQEGIFQSPHALLVHTRLCVIDPENGRQPMTARREGRTCTLVYNGELYNTEELRRSLLLAGWTFRGHSDTEVLLKAYIEWGPACVERGRRKRRGGAAVDRPRPDAGDGRLSTYPGIAAGPVGHLQPPRTAAPHLLVPHCPAPHGK